MRKVLLFGMVVALLLIPSAAFAYTPGDTPTAFTIIATGSANTLTYQDGGGQVQSTEEASTINTVVVAMYGFNPNLETPADQTTTAGQPVVYSYVITNEGNDSDTYGVSYSNTYGGDGAGWEFYIRQLSDGATIESVEDEVGITNSVAEDADLPIYLQVVPGADPVNESPNGASATVTITITTDAEPVGEYTGANANEYGGTSEATDTTVTSILAGEMTLSRVATVDAPTEYIANKGGGHHDPVPGAVITYSLSVSNEGSDAAVEVIIVDKVPYSTTGSHISAETGSQGEVPNVTITAPSQEDENGWSAFYSTSSSPDMNYGDTSDWTALGSGLSIEAIAADWYVKWEKASVAEGESAELNWGVAIE